MGEFDRRAFLQKAGVTGAAAGGLWLAPSVLGSSSAFAAGSCVNSAGLAWGTRFANGALASNTGADVTGTAAIPASGSSGAIHVLVTIHPSGSPGNGNADGVNAGTTFNGYTSFLKLSMTNNAAAEGYDVTFNFYSGTTGTTPINVYNLTFSVIDIDRNNAGGGNGFNDRVWLTSGFSILSQGSEIAAGTAGTSGNPWTGTGTGGVTDDTGTARVQYAGPVNTVTMSYRSFELLNGVQSIGITDLTWCY